MKRPILFTAAALVLSGAAVAQYAINKSRIAGGGGTSTGGGYSLSGTFGQAEAGGPMTGGGYALTGGYWAAPVLIQGAGGPQMTIVKNPNQSVTVRWPSPSTGYVLQQSVNLTAWSNSNLAVADDGTFRSVNFVPSGSRLYFRLARP